MKQTCVTFIVNLFSILTLSLCNNLRIYLKRFVLLASIVFKLHIHTLKKHCKTIYGDVIEYQNHTLSQISIRSGRNILKSLLKVGMWQNYGYSLRNVVTSKYKTINRSWERRNISKFTFATYIFIFDFECFHSIWYECNLVIIL